MFHAFKTGLMKGKEGITNNNVVLTNEIVLEIRKKYATGNYSQPMLAREYNCSQSHIQVITSRKIWKHI